MLMQTMPIVSQQQQQPMQPVAMAQLPAYQRTCNYLLCLL